MMRGTFVCLAACIAAAAVLFLSSPASAATCAAGSYIENTMCHQCPPNMIQAASAAYECAPCPSGSGPDATGIACTSCAPGSYKPLHENGWIHSTLQSGVMSLRMFNSPYFLCRVNSGAGLRVMLGFESDVCSWSRVPATNGASGAWSLADPTRLTSYMTWLYDGAVAGRDFKVNMTTSSGTTQWKTRTSFVASSSVLAQPNDADNIPMQNHAFVIQSSSNSSIVLDCDLPKQVGGTTQDGDCYWRNANALGSGANQYKQATFMVAPPLHNPDTVIESVTLGRTYECERVGLGDLPTQYPDLWVSLQPFSTFVHYPMVGSDKKLYAQRAYFDLFREWMSFEILPALDGTLGAVSFRSFEDLSLYITAPLSSTPLGATTLSVSASIPTVASDASFRLLQGCTNGSYALDFYTLQSTKNATYYLYMNQTSDRANPVVMKNISNPLTALTWDEKQKITWRLVRGLVTNTRQEIATTKVATFKSRATSKIVGQDETARTMTSLTTASITSALANIHIVPPLAYVPDAVCAAGSQHSFYFSDGTTGERYYLYVANTTVSGDTYASYNVLTTITPTLAVTNAAVTNAAYPQSFVFCIQRPLDTATFQWGFSLSLSNDSNTYILASGSAYTATRPISATQKQQATFSLSGPWTSSYFSPFSHSLKCTSCPFGSYTSTYGNSACTLCAAGSYALAGSTTCTQCAAGTYQASAAQSTCANCPAGQSSVAGASTCTACAAGQFSVAGGACTNCPAGYYSASGDEECTECLPGAYSEGGASVCTDCAAGSFSDSNATALCTLCPLHSYAAVAGSTECTACAVNTCFTDAVGQIASKVCGTDTPVSRDGKVQCIDNTVATEGHGDYLSDSWKWPLLGTSIGLAVLVVALGVVVVKMKMSSYSAL